MTDTVPQPAVEWINPALARWTFHTEDRDEQQRQFNHWCGWFGFDEDEQPHLMAGNVWVFHHPRPDAPSVEIGDAEARAFLEQLKSRPDPTPAEQAMIDNLEEAWRETNAASERNGRPRVDRSPGRPNIADDKSKVGRQDRARISLDEDYEVTNFAQKHGITPDRAREIIKQAGGRRGLADQIAGRWK